MLEKLFDVCAEVYCRAVIVECETFESYSEQVRKAIRSSFYPLEDYIFDDTKYISWVYPEGMT